MSRSDCHDQSPDHAVVSSFTVLAGQRDAIGTAVAVVAVPFPPVATLAADLAVPRTSVLSDTIPAERIPILLIVAARAMVIPCEFTQRYFGMATGQLNQRVQLILSQRLQTTDILYRAGGQLCYIHTVEGILASLASTPASAAFPILQTGTATRITGSFASAIRRFVGRHESIWKERI